jgi:hypothetical protein
MEGVEVMTNTIGVYILDDQDNPVLAKSNEEWVEWSRQNWKRRLVALDYLPNGKRVSTVFLKIDHRFGNEGPPVLYETMVFQGESFDDLDCERYSTKEQAIAGHKAMMEKHR